MKRPLQYILIFHPHPSISRIDSFNQLFAYFLPHPQLKHSTKFCKNSTSAEQNIQFQKYLVFLDFDPNINHLFHFITSGQCPSISLSIFWSSKNLDINSQFFLSALHSGKDLRNGRHLVQKYRVSTHKFIMFFPFLPDWV